jgi:hypothetical protein
VKAVIRWPSGAKSELSSNVQEAAEHVHAGTVASWENKRSSPTLSEAPHRSKPMPSGCFGDPAGPITSERTADDLQVLAPIWLDQARKTARRVRQRVRPVLDCARGAYTLSGANPVGRPLRGLIAEAYLNAGDHLAAHALWGRACVCRAAPPATASCCGHPRLRRS